MQTTTKYKIQSDKLFVRLIFSLSISLIIFCSSESCSKNSYIKYRGDKIFYAKQKNATIVLRALSDSNYIKCNDSISAKQFTSVIYSLAKNSNIEPNWYCGFTGCAYPSISLGKSIYKIDLLHWMSYFHCVDTALLNNSQGQFSEFEIKYIRQNKDRNIIIDTTILDSHKNN